MIDKTWAIYKKEMRNYFLSPMAYILIGFFLILSGYFFSTFILASRLAQMQAPLSNMTLILIFVIPILTMRLLAEERREGTEQLLLTSPVSITSLVIGKYLAAIFVLIVILVLTGVYPAILYWFGQPDPGPLFTGYLGFFLLGAASISVGTFASSVTENQIIAAVIGFAMLLMFWIIDWVAGILPTGARVFEWLSIFYHFDDFRRGVIDTGNLIYYLSMIFFFIFLTIQNIERKRWS